MAQFVYNTLTMSNI